MSAGHKPAAVFRALRLDDEVRRRLIATSMRTRFPIVIGALFAAVLFAISGVPRMEWGIGACAMIAIEGVVSKRYPSVPRTIVVDSLALAVAVEFLPLPLEFSGLAFLYFGIVIMLMTWGWKAWGLAVYLSALYTAVAFFDPFGEIVRSQAQIIAFGFVAGLIFVLLTMTLIGSVISLLQSQSERIEAARASLELLMRSKDEFVASVSHELRTPLTGVVGFASELHEHWEMLQPDEQRALVGIVADQGVEVAYIVDDLLVAARAGSDSLTIVSQELDLMDETRRVLNDLGADHMEVRSELGELPATGDPLRLRQVIRNLITNAQRYGGETVWVEMSSSGGIAVLAVCDDGPGIPTDAVDRIFEAYEQTDASESQPASVGLGLSVARTLARLMHGDLVYRRRPDTTVFELSLPATLAAVTPVEGAA